MTVLIVEDEEGMAALLREWLQGLVTMVRVVRTLAEAQSVLRSVQVDLVYLDLGLPDSNVEHTLSAIKDMQASHPNTVFIAFSAHPVPSGVADGVIRKSDVVSQKDLCAATVPAVIRFIRRKPCASATLDALEQLTRVMLN